jgi:glycosyltransferase involved in cell wall biosynthesis
MRRAIRAHAAAHPVDVWQFEWLAYADCLSDFRRSNSIIMAHNVESLIWQRYYENESNPAKRWYIKRQWHKFQRFERRIFNQVARVVAVSLEDAKLARSEFGIEHVDVVENGVDSNYYQAVAGVRNARQILFLGSLDWRPNLDGVRVFLDQVLPAVRAQEPAAHVCIVGRNPPAWLRQLSAASPFVRLHADVEDVRPYLAESSIMAVPLRIGGGSRLKILEALAANLPVVSTRIGAEGLSLEPARHLIVVDEVKAMADQIVRCLRRPQEAYEMAARGRDFVRENYDWSVLAQKLERVWEACAKNKARDCVC